uniref:Uncharacterized protein n=1 Tax=Anguilla anguilla TaxID=7936 RepID=A0A0E9Q3N1_ANGAN
MKAGLKALCNRFYQQPDFYTTKILMCPYSHLHHKPVIMSWFFMASDW